ncbi:MAG: chemotaxis protein CheV [Deltaproteobacteria bacterium]
MNENSPTANALKLIVFRINEEQPFYGINVFKTFEIQRAKHFRISEVPRANEYIEGIVYIRNQPVPLVNLPRWLRTDLSEQEERNSSIIFCNFNNIQIALRVGGIHQIITRDWQDVLPLKFHEYMPVDRNLNYTLLDDGSSVCLILDVEYLLTEVLPHEFSEIQEDVQNLPLNNVEIPESLKNGTILVAEDSRSAQLYLKNFFEKLNLSFKIFEHGGPLLEYVQRISDLSKIPLIITDKEKPIISGHEVIIQ